jgi:pilus assembly protein Flp/PilA
MKALREIYEKVVARFFGYLYSEEGQGLVEYALILVLIALVVIAMLKGVGQQVNSVYSRINSGLAQP